MAVARCLIVNADDFGQCPGVNRGIIHAFEHGIVTSASLMVRWPAAAAAAAYAQKRPMLSLGLHLDLAEWVYREDTWMPLYEVVPMEDATAVREEVCRQLAAFRRLMGRDPTHIDSHQHVHRYEPVSSVTRELAHELHVALRHFSPEFRFCGDFYGQTENGSPYPHGISVDNLLTIVAGLPPGTTELACHPGEGVTVDTMYRQERAEEVKTLCDSHVRSALVAQGITLRAFGEPFAETT